MTNLAKLRRALLIDPEVQAAYDRLSPIFPVVGEMIDARRAAGLTQADIAASAASANRVLASSMESFMFKRRASPPPPTQVPREAGR